MSYKVIIGFITYGDLTAKYLPYFLDSLKGQTGTDFTILAFDNSEDEDNANVRYLKTSHQDIEIRRAGGNLGFARAYNILIKRARDAGAEYFFAVNPDTAMAPGAVGRLADELDRGRKLGSVCPKILRWDFAGNEKTDIIDSCGIIMKRGLRFIDLGQGERDRGQYDKASVLGPSGAAAMYRLSALESAKQNGQYFDELMFMYKEDCDLAYRLFLTGFASRLVPDAVVYHDRTAAGGGESDLAVARNRRRKGRTAKEWSFLDQHIIFLKYWRQQDFFGRLGIIWYAFRMFVFVLLFERYLLAQYRKLRGIRERIHCPRI